MCLVTHVNLLSASFVFFKLSSVFLLLTLSDVDSADLRNSFVSTSPSLFFIFLKLKKKESIISSY